MLILDKIGDNKSIKVSIICNTYNHRPYIEKTLNSFLNQKTNFLYEIIIHDDASDDGTTGIVMKYAKENSSKVRAIVESENQYSQDIDADYKITYPMANGKYIATCEGDDSWNDMNKLQKQYDFLESNTGYSAVAGVTRYFDDNDKELLKALPTKKYRGKNALEKNVLTKSDANIATNTIMYRKQYAFDKEFLEAIKISRKVWDILRVLKLFEKGKIYVFEDCFQFHRIQTRKNASNYNSIFNEKQKILNSIMVVKAVDECYSQKHDLTKWIYHQLASYFSHCIKKKSLNDFYECIAILPESYKKHVKLNIGLGLMNLVKEKNCLILKNKI